MKKRTEDKHTSRWELWPCLSTKGKESLWSYFIFATGVCHRKNNETQYRKCFWDIVPEDLFPQVILLLYRTSEVNERFSQLETTALSNNFWKIMFLQREKVERRESEKRGEEKKGEKDEHREIGKQPRKKSKLFLCTYDRQSPIS